MKMKKFAAVMLSVVAICLIAPAAFAQTEPAGAVTSTASWVVITAGFSMAIAAAACAYAQGKASAAAFEGMARNPGASGAIQNMLILALVFPESLALFTFATMFIRVK
jgi:F-type H+-transporting ATPase subunit c